MTEPKTDPMWFLAPAPRDAVVVTPHRSPWLQAPPLRVHVARTIEVYVPNMLRAAEAGARRSR